MCAEALRGSRAGIKSMAEVLLPAPPPAPLAPPPPPAPLPLPPTASKRIFMTCRPFVGANDKHLYEPPFGLHVYDSRFQNPNRKSCQVAA